MSSLFPPILELIPHRPPMVLLDEVIAVEPGRVTCRATLQPDCVFAQDGLVHPATLIELVAQACAAYVKLLPGDSDGSPRLGLIMGSREATFEVEHLAVGDVLTVVAHKQYGERQLASFLGTVMRGDELCATIQLSVVDAAAPQEAS